MPDTDTQVIEPPPVQLDPNASSDQVFAAFHAADAQHFADQAQKPAFPQPVAEKPAPAKEEPKPEAKEEKTGLEIPDQFLGKKDEAKPEDEWDVLSKEEPKGPIKHEGYKKLVEASSKKMGKLQQEIADREAKIAELSKRGDSEATLARLKAAEEALAEKEALLEREAVQHSSQFKERFTKKETAIADQLKATAADTGLDNEVIQQALTSTLKRRIELLDNVDMSPSVRSRVDSLMVQYDLLQSDKNQFLEQSKEEAARWRQEQQQSITQQEQQRRQQEDKIFDSIGDEMAKTYAPFQDVEGNPQWNAQAKALRDEAKKYFNGEQPLEDLARVVYKGVGAVVQEKITAALHAKLEAAHKEIAALKTAQPGANGHIPNPSGEEDDRHLSPEERYKRTFQRMVGPAQNQGFR